MKSRKKQLCGLLAPRLYIIGDLETVFGMNRIMTYKNRYNHKVCVTFKCRTCKVSLSDPEELRIHNMVEHKGHMIRAVKI